MDFIDHHRPHRLLHRQHQLAHRGPARAVRHLQADLDLLAAQCGKVAIRQQLIALDPDQIVVGIARSRDQLEGVGVRGIRVRGLQPREEGAGGVRG